VAGVRKGSNPEKHRPGQAAVLRLRREPGLGEHRRPRRQPGLLDPARCPPRRPPRQSLGHQTLALPALRDRRENHHPRPPQPAAATGISARERPFETAPGKHRTPQTAHADRWVSWHHPVPTRSPTTGRGTGANPKRTKGHTTLPGNRKHPSEQPSGPTSDPQPPP
jgi:hypothetical protein